MDTITLVDSAKEDGERFLDALDAWGYPVSAAFWLYMPEKEGWRLIVATPKHDTDGPRAVYRSFLEVLTEITPKSEITLNDIWAVAPDEPLVKALSSSASAWKGAGCR